MEEILLFVACYIFVLIVYELIFVRPMKKYRSNPKKYKKEKKELVEIKYLVSKYNLDMKKVNYNQLLQIVALVSSLDITIMVTVITLFDNYLLSFLLCIIVIMPIIMISYWFVFRFYKKKGMIKNV